MLSDISLILLNSIFVTALTASLIMVPFLRRWGMQQNILDLPDERKVFFQWIPSLGEIAICLVFIFALRVYVDLQHEMRSIIAGILIIFVTGLKAELQSSYPLRKLFGEICAVLAAMAIANLYDIYNSLANKQKKTIQLQIFSLFGVYFVLLVSSYASWEVIAFWHVEEAWPLLVTTTFASLLSIWIFSNLRQFPLGSRFQNIVDSVTLPFVAEVIIFLLTGWFYSNIFLIISFAGVIFLLCICDHIFLKSKSRQVVVMPDGTMEYTHCDRALFHQPAGRTGGNGAVIDYQQELHTDGMAFVSHADSSDFPVCSAGTLYEVCTGKLSLNHLVIEGHNEFRPSLTYSSVKELMDIVLVLLSLPVTIPVMMIVALAVRLDSPGPVFFRQERVGQHGNKFMMWKFRSMRVDSEVNGAQFASKNDSRVTRVGKFIRKFRFDELPQFWNVIKGDMSLIGPRPEQEAFVRDFEREIPSYSYRHLVKPGITGWAQVSQGYAASQDETREKLEFDLFYAKHFSFWLDLCIIRKTIVTILTGFGSR